MSIRTREEINEQLFLESRRPDIEMFDKQMVMIEILLDIRDLLEKLTAQIK